MALERIQRSVGSGGAKNPPRSRAFFLEMLLNMLIFALCAVVVLQVFMEAKLATNESAALTRLTLEAQSLAEQYKVNNGAEQNTNATTYYYDANYAKTDNAQAPYSIAVKQLEGVELPQGVHAVSIEGYDGAKKLFSLQVESYTPRGGA